MAEENSTQTQETPADKTDFGQEAVRLMYGKTIPTTQQPEENKIETEVVEEKENIVKTPLGEIKVENNQPNFFTAINEKTGYTFSNETELIEKLLSLKSHEENAKLIEENVLNKGIRELVSKAPKDIQMLLAEVEKGGDYRSLAKSIYVDGIDYTQNVDKIDEYNLVSFYNKDIDKETFDDMGERERKALVNSSKQLFASEKSKFEEETERVNKANADYAEKVVDSVKRTVEKLRKDMPDLPESKVKAIEIRLYSNPNFDIIDEKSRVYTDDAATKLAWQLYGQETLNSYAQSLNAKVNSEIEVKTKQRVSEELELYAKSRGEAPKVLAGEKKGSDPIDVVKQSMGNFLKDSSSRFVNKTERK